MLRALNRNIDWILFSAILPLLAAGLVTMNSFVGENYFFERQLVWMAVSLAIFFLFSFVDWRFLKRSGIVAGLFVFMCIVLASLLVLGHISRGAQSWFRVGGASIEPADFAKILLIVILAKYFSRRHIEIANIRHILISGIYALVPFTLVFLHPDFGSAIIIFIIWLGMTMVSGISKKHLAAVFAIGLVSFAALWLFVFKPYQKARIVTFLDPLADVRGAGYNAYQSQIAVGSGQIVGKGVGHGTQSRLNFLPEYQTDFIFAAFAEEWGFVGVTILFALFWIIIWRILANAMIGPTNFEMLYGMGLAIYLMAHVVINIGMNIGLLPVTGIPLPFLSYGGSHILAEFMGLGILMGMRRYSRAAHRDDMRNEFVGL
jgi:rod shape determining protein RodA